MTNSSLGYSEPGSPNKRLFSRSLSEDALTKDVQGILVCDASGNVVSVTSNRLLVDASGVAVPVTDNGSSLTVDGTVDTELPAAAALADAASNPTAPAVGAHNLLWNAATSQWERQRLNMRATMLVSAARTATTSSTDLTNYNHRGIHVFLNVTAGSGFSLTPKIEGKDPLTGVYYNLHADPTAVAATGLYVYVLYPGENAAAAGGVTMRVAASLPMTYRVTIAQTATSATYSVYHQLIL